MEYQGTIEGVQVTLRCRYDGADSYEDEEFESGGDYVTYTELTDRFDEDKVNRFIEEATNSLRGRAQ